MKPIQITLALATTVLGLSTATVRAQEPAGKHGNWQGSVGLVSGSVGSYYGSDARRTLGAPLVGLVYRNRLMIGTTTSGGLGGGIEYLLKQGTVSAALGVSGVERRREDRADALAGMDDRSGGTYATASLGAHVGPVAAISNTSLGLNREAGVMQMLGLQLGGTVAPRVQMSIGGSATFANRNNMAFDFGITEEQAARRRELIAAGDGRLRDGDATPFTPEGGFKEMRGTVQVAYSINGPWRVVGVVSGGRLAADLADSPLARKRDALTMAAGFAYGF